MFGLLAAITKLALQEATNADGEASPQLRGVPGEQDVPEVVVAITAQRLSELGIGVVVLAVAPEWPSVWALAVVGASRVAATRGADRVDRAEAGRGQGDEHLRVIGHGGRDVVVSAT